ncbi:MAG: Nudix family hydrolase [Pseudomonadota bacterium]|nr:Nudix family hydrolase [Pseudomonadota bacterium]
MRSIHVVAGVIVNQAGEVLLALRPKEKHQGGLWEFPGGKVELGEAALAALKRELQEELGIAVTQARPLIRVQHSYPDKAVLLDVWRVEAFDGVAHGREGQAVEWVAPEQLPLRAFPAANHPIVTAARLPERYLITPEPEQQDAFLQQLELALQGGIRLVQLRAKTLDEAAYRSLAAAAVALCQRYQARLLLNAAPQVALELGADGVHLSSQRLLALEARPAGFAASSGRWVAGSCHNARELQHAVAIGVDFVVLSPIKPTLSHPDVMALGWQQMQTLIDPLPLPVYALGGMGTADLSAAFAHGAQGIAAIRALWPTLN